MKDFSEKTTLKGMDLEGSVERFELTDIFQLLSASKKTGTLGVQKGEEVMMVYFQDGNIIYAHNPNREIKLGDLLIQKKKITPLQLEKVMRAQKDLKTKKRLGELLVLESFITEEELEKVVKQQVEDVIYELLKWDRGSFKFYENRFPTQEEITINISTENLILESVRRSDEMARIQAKLPSMNTVLGLAITETDRAKDVTLEADEWNILTLVDGHRSIKKIVEDSRLEKLETLKKLTGFLLAGLIEPVKKPVLSLDTQRLERSIERLTKLLEKYQ
jgi:hypothetical protein